MNQSLYESLGGDSAVNAAVEIFYRRVLQDERISHFFDDVDMDRQMAKQRAFLSFAFGGPVQYTGKSMREAHAPLVARGLNESHFTAVAEHLQGTLEELGVSSDLIAQVMSVAGSVHDEVLNL